MKKVALILAGVLLTPYVSAGVEQTVTLDFPLYNGGYEIGQLTESGSYFALSGHYGGAGFRRVEVKYAHLLGNTDRHSLGLGYGGASFNELDVDDFEADDGGYVSLNYNFYSNGMRSSGFNFNASAKFFDGDFLPFIGFGYNF